MEDAPEIKVLSTAELGEGVDATPAMVGSQLIVRGEKHVFSFSE
jgi:hypothetical protein